MFHQYSNHIQSENRKTENRKNQRYSGLNLHNSTSHCFQQKSGNKCKDSSTVVDGRNNEEHEIYVVDSTTVDCKSCCCSDGKIAKKPMKAKSNIYRHLVSALVLPIGTYRSPIKQTGFGSWSTPGL